LSLFNTVVLDVDSTLTAVEGIDWLAARRSPELAAEVARLTQQAMEGTTQLDSVYGRRLKLVKPSRTDVEALGAAYVDAMAPEAHAVVRELQTKGVEVRLISGGLAPAVRYLADHIGIALTNVHAVDAYFDDAGRYSGYDRMSPLTRQSGKRELVELLDLAPPVLMVGDGMTDVEVIPAVDGFVAFTGFASRPAVVARADHTISRLRELLKLVLG